MARLHKNPAKLNKMVDLNVLKLIPVLLDKCIHLYIKTVIYSLVNNLMIMLTLMSTNKNLAYKFARMKQLQKYCTDMQSKTESLINRSRETG